MSTTRHRRQAAARSTIYYHRRYCDQHEGQGGQVADAEAEREVRAAFDRQVAAMRAADREGMGALLTDGSTHIGTDPDEWWTKKDFLAVLDNAMRVDGEPLEPEMGDLHIHVHGDVAWMESTGNFVNGEGAKRPIRMTSVFVRGNGQWRTAQSHTSVGVPNTELFSHWAPCAAVIDVGPLRGRVRSGA